MTSIPFVRFSVDVDKVALPLVDSAMTPFPLPATPFTPAPEPVFLNCLHAPDVEHVVMLNALSVDLTSWAVAGLEAMQAHRRQGLRRAILIHGSNS